MNDKRILRSTTRQPGEPDFNFWCPGCNRGHPVWTSRIPSPWSFNGNLECPTFSPSFLMTWNEGEPPVTSDNFDEWKRAPWPQTQVAKRCHIVITDGMLHFCSDCTHEFAGKVVPMEPF